MSLVETLIERLSGHEGLEIEFKRAQNSLPSNLWETISAFANTNGGWIILGVGENEGFTIEGVKNAQKMMLDLFNLSRSTQKVSASLFGSSDISIESIDNKDLVLVRVPAAPRKTRPIYVNNNPYLGTYVRRHSGDFRCTKPEIDRMMREAADIAADSSIVIGLSTDDLDLTTLAHYRRRYLTANPASPWNNYEDQRFLEAIGAYRWDSETDRRGFTVAGLLLFGKSNSIRSWRSRHLVDYRLVSPNVSAETRWDDRIAWEGNLLDGYFEIYPRLTLGLPVPFRLEGSMRINESLIHVALREALVNLLVHTDYAETGVSLIISTPEQFSFRNPGSSRISERDLLTGDRSDPRNPELVKMFRYIGLAEEAGTGIPKILSAWRSLGFQFPNIDTGTERYEFNLVLRLAHLLSPQDRKWLGTLGLEWTEPEQLALVLARHEETIDNAALREITGQHSADITKVLTGLRSKGFLEMIGSGRHAQYRLSARANSYNLPLFSEVDNTEVDYDPVLSTENPVLSAENPVLSAENPVLSTRQEDAEWKDLESIAEQARTQPRLSIDSLENIILRLCSKYHLSAEELAQLTHRNKEYLRRVLRNLIQSKKLRYYFQDQPYHPQQRYITEETL